MDPQRYIIAKIEPEMEEPNSFNWLKHISETSLLTVENYPALLVEDDKPYGTSGSFGDGTHLQKNGEYMMSLIIKTENLKDMKRADYRAAKAEIMSRMDEIQNYIAACVTAAPKFEEDGKAVMIAGMSFEPGDLNFVEIDSTPALMLTVPVKAVYFLG
ncbi:MAG TPA: hypothetical protein PKE39_04270 [Ignavibacteria bacterium]|nr:hypothetical protein [Ignavibacteria bacterium]